VKVVEVGGIGGMDNDHLGVGMVDDFVYLAGRESGIQRDVAQTALLGGELPYDRIDAIREDQDDHVAGLKTDVPESPHELVGPSGKFSECQSCTARRVDDRQVIGMILRDPPHTQPLVLPGILHGRHGI
jgi:hypothetical protein